MNQKARNGISNVKNPYCKGFETLQKYHTTTHKRPYSFFEVMINSRTVLYKDHILPTEEQIKWIKKINKPVVILLRNVDDTIDNYKRLLKNYKSGKLDKKTEKELQVRLLYGLDFGKFCEDLYEFNKLWRYAELPKALYIDYNELVMCPYRICKKIIEHYGYKMPKVKNFQLVRAKGNHGYNTFTGVGYERAKKEYEKNLHS
jgi:hypothetical protein